MKSGNLYRDALPPACGERFDTLLSHRNLVIERIVSSAGLTPQTYVQTQDEWVMVVQGEADLDVAGEKSHLVAGDHLFLPAGTPHSVERTTAGTVWLAVHLHPENS